MVASGPGNLLYIIACLPHFIMQRLNSMPCMRYNQLHNDRCLLTRAACFERTCCWRSQVRSRSDGMPSKNGGFPPGTAALFLGMPSKCTLFSLAVRIMSLAK